MDPGVADPVRLGPGAEQDLGHGQADQFGIGQQRRPAQPSWCADRVIDLHVQCGQEGVEVLRHNMIIDTLLLCPRADLRFRNCSSRSLIDRRGICASLELRRAADFCRPVDLLS